MTRTVTLVAIATCPAVSSTTAAALGANLLDNNFLKFFIFLTECHGRLSPLYGLVRLAKAPGGFCDEQHTCIHLRNQREKTALASKQLQQIRNTVASIRFEIDTVIRTPFPENTKFWHAEKRCRPPFSPVKTPRRLKRHKSGRLFSLMPTLKHKHLHTQHKRIRTHTVYPFYATTRIQNNFFYFK